MNVKFIKLIPPDIYLHIYAHSSFVIIVSELLKHEVSFLKRISSNSEPHRKCLVVWKAYPVWNQTCTHL